jgi:hypothetical protein
MLTQYPLKNNHTKQDAILSNAEKVSRAQNKKAIKASDQENVTNA